MTHINDDAPTSNPYQAPRTSETIDTPLDVRRSRGIKFLPSDDAEINALLASCPAGQTSSPPSVT